MRLAVCALSAVLLSGCSWLGGGGGFNDGQVSSNGAFGAYGANCLPGQAVPYGQNAAHGFNGAAGCVGGQYGVAQGAGFGQQGFGQGAGFGQAGFGQAGFGQGAGFGQAGFGQAGVGQGAGFGQAGFGQAGVGQGVGFGQAGFGQAGVGQGVGFGQAGFGQAGVGQGIGFGQQSFGPGAVGAGLTAQGIGGTFNGAGFGTNGVTTLGAAAPFGAAAFGGNVVGSQLANGQFVNGAAVQNVVGAPIFVPQPFAAPFAVPQLRGVGAPLPFGFEVFGGTEFDIGGTLATREEVSPSFGGGGQAGTFPDVSYSDAFSEGYTVGGAGTFDISRNTTLIGQASFSEKNGRSVDTGSFQSGVFDSAGVFTPDIGSNVPRDLVGEFSDLQQYTIEGGVRQYVGNSFSAVRPYVAATGGFTYNNDVDLRQTFVDDGTVFDDSQFIESGWRPTAAGVVGAELAVGARSAIGIESGIRWRDNLDANTDAEDRWSVPLKLRGRVSF